MYRDKLEIHEFYRERGANIVEVDISRFLDGEVHEVTIEPPRGSIVVSFGFRNIRAGYQDG